MPRQRPMSNSAAGAGGRRGTPLMRRAGWLCAKNYRKHCRMNKPVCIPVVDVREGGPVRHALDARTRARALRDDCVTWLPRPARMLLPAMDALTRRWLQRSHSPYVMDLEAIAVALGFPGIWFLNGTYQWGCTTVARDEDGVPWLARTLDWPVPGLRGPLQDAPLRGPAGGLLHAD